ncbi:pyocin knob domain-containing protein [Lentilactobacillus buchneri]|uniref:pyocin knob domain-containing protein n=1 Tax=Lentilactobacillus buchneri TaxID=1581 RepID=UPI0020C000A2|nr:pyocin knob domain-containing protein [Lentilactobacillus buchneri]
MATPNVGILTNAGKNLIDQVNAGQTKITFSKIVFSSMANNQLTDDQIKALTTVAPQEIVVNNPEVTLDNNTGETRIRATGNNEALTDGVYVKTYAVYAKNDSGNEILYGITVSPNPNYLPEYDGVTPQAITYSYKVNISNTSNITFTNSNDVYVSDTDLAEALQPYAKTVDVNQQLDKKVTDNGDGTIKVNGNSILPSNDSILGRIDDGTYTDMNNVPIGWWYLNGWSASAPNISNWGLPKALYYIHCFTTSSNGLPTAIQVAYATELNNVYVRTMTNSNWNSWKLTADDSKVVHTADMRKPASDVAGIEEVNAKQDKIGYTPADDSKVAHLSGANNFDTVPTVNNNPLLLASSLPSDLARTGQAQTFTQPQTFSIAPVINDASTDKGDNQAATMADLKSVENSAWRVLDQSNAPSTISFRGQVLYKIDDANKIIYFTTNGLMTNNGSNLILIDFKGIVNNLLSGYGRLASIARKTYIDDSDISVTSTYVKNSSILNYQEDTNVNLISYGGPGQNYAYVIYDSLVNN